MCSQDSMTSPETSIAVLLTCHNRKETTLNCLARLFSQKLPEATILRVFLVDDGCTDGTGDAVRAAHQDVEVIQGDGSLFWCNGMRLAWDHAAKEDFDFYLWLNDDTTLLDGGLQRLLDTYSAVGERSQIELECRDSVANTHHPRTDESERTAIIVGSCCDPQSRTHTYGGKKRLGRHPCKFAYVVAEEEPLECDTFEGNVVLVPRCVFQKVGNMLPFSHAMGDTDYGYRARQAGCSVWVAPGFIGECIFNSEEDFFNGGDWSLRERIRVLNKRLPPKDWFRLLWLHSGVRAFMYWPIPYLRVILNLRRDLQAKGDATASHREFVVSHKREYSQQEGIA